MAGVVVEPSSLDQLGEVIRKCERDRMALAPLGACRTLRYLRSAPVEVAISLSAMAQVIRYEPDDMTVVAAPRGHDARRARHGARRPRATSAGRSFSAGSDPDWRAYLPRPKAVR